MITFTTTDDDDIVLKVNDVNNLGFLITNREKKSSTIIELTIKDIEQLIMLLDMYKEILNKNL